MAPCLHLVSVLRYRGEIAAILPRTQRLENLCVGYPRYPFLRDSGRAGLVEGAERLEELHRSRASQPIESGGSPAAVESASLLPSAAYAEQLSALARGVAPQAI